jgi:alpha-beta hydrolase superfamily lysophospholipase
MSSWLPDAQLPGFEAAQFDFPLDYGGEVVATLVRMPGPRRARAVLYVHGFIDYFFQRHMAERFEEEGYSFYALDLRKHGRSWLSHQHPCFCKDLSEYYADITSAIDAIGEETGGAPLVLAGHSTGGLVCALYAHEGERRARIAALWLNSPFFEFNAPPAAQRKLAIAAAIGRIAPFLNDSKALLPFYPMSIHKDHRGEWDFDLRLKPIKGFPAYFGWVRAVRLGHALVQAGLSIGCPVLSMHSERSDGGTEWKESFRSADIVLDVDHIRRWSPGLGRKVKTIAIRDGLHDLVLSRKDVREQVFEKLFDWLKRAVAG